MEGATTLRFNRGARWVLAALSPLVWLGILGAGARLHAQEPAARAVTIADGTPVHLCLMDDINSKKNKVGDVIRFKVRESVEVEGVVIIPVGAGAVGKVVKIGRPRLMGHSGALGLSFDYAVAMNGARIPLRGEANVKGGGRGATTGVSAAWFGPAASIHKGAVMNAYVKGNQSFRLPAHEKPN